MPYVSKQARLRLNHGGRMETAGELNYKLTMLINMYMHYMPQNYQAMNDVIGALEAAKCEFYRRIVIPYETQKIAENGDVYGT